MFMAINATSGRAPLAADASERETLGEVERLMAGEQSPKLMGAEGQAVELPETVVALLRQLVHDLARERAVTVVAVGKELTTQEAAAILNVSRPYLIKLLERGEIPFTMVGTHRRIPVGDLLAYKRRRDERRRAGLADLTQMSQEMGMYDLHAADS
jgi:excisionase family DNA binding protein